ncbi:MAG: GNAT family N-acetyltransferase [Clostridia bacterium]|nr:GNAT family N-acetyltransferase [Clostridia bacterium]
MTFAVRRFKMNETRAVAKLIYETVHRVCAADYTPEQLDAWAPPNMDTLRLMASLIKNYTLVATAGGVVVGVISTENDGYINRLFTHYSYQQRGIASALLLKTEQWAGKQGIRTLTLEASYTAIDFYIKKGFRITGTEKKVRNGVDFLNTKMIKDL